MSCSLCQPPLYECRGVLAALQNQPLIKKVVLVIAPGLAAEMLEAEKASFVLGLHQLLAPLSEQPGAAPN